MLQFVFEYFYLGALTALEDAVELRSGDDGQAIGDDGVVGIVAVVVDEDFAGGTHVGVLF